MKTKLLLISLVLCLGFSRLALCQSIPNYLPANGLMAWWPFNGNANDESGNGNNGIVNGPTLASDRFGNAGKAYSFSGQNGVNIQVPASPAIQPTAALSLSVWVRVQSSAGWQNFVCKRYQYTTDPFNSYIIGEYSADGNQYNPNSNERYFGGALTSNSLSSVGAIDGQNRSLNEWRNYILTYNGQKIRLYHNGAMVSENDGSGPIQYSNLPLFFGTTSLDNQNFIGDLDDIAIWNIALTSEQITQLYESQVCAQPLTVNIIGSGIIGANSGSDIAIQAQANLDSTRFQWQAETAGMPWNDLSKNVRYQATDSSRLRVTGITVANHLQKFRVIGKKGACRDTSGIVVLQLSDTCITSIIDTNFVTITDTSFVTVTDTNLITITDTNFVTVTDTSFISVFDTTYITLTDTNLVTVTDTLIINTIVSTGNPIVRNIIKAYPNPTAGMLYINTGNFALMSGYSLRITSALGQLVFESPINQNLFSIPLGDFTSSGLYYLRLFNSAGDLVTTRKIVLQP
jgi:hypothetical protein